MIEVGESEASEVETNSDTPKTPQNEPNDYEKLMDVIVSQKKSKMEASNLQKVANSLVDLGQPQGKRTSTHLRRSQRVYKYAKFVSYDDGHDDGRNHDGEYMPNDGGLGDGHGDGDGRGGDGDDHGHGDGDGGISKENEGEGIVKKMKKSNKKGKKKKKVGNECDIMEIARFYSQEDENLRKTGATSLKVRFRKSDPPKSSSQEPLDNEANEDDDGDADKNDDDVDADKNDDEGDGCMNSASKDLGNEGIVKKKNNEKKKKVGNACEIMDIAPLCSQEDENLRKFSSNSKKLNDDDDGDDDKNVDGGINGSSKEREDEGIVKKMKNNNEKKKKSGNGREIIMRNLRKSNSKKVVAPPKVLIPDSSLQFTGFCEEKIQLVFPKASEDEVKKLMDRFPKGFRGFSRQEGERALRWIAGLKEDYWKLRRSHVDYPEFREEVVEGLPFPKGFKGFNLAESKQISGVIVSLEAAYSRLRDYFQSDMNEGAKVSQPFVRHEASGLQPLEASCPPTTQVSCPQQQASSFTTSPVQPDAQMLPYKFPGSRPPVHHEALGSHNMETPLRPTTQASGPQQQPSTSTASPAHSDVPISSRFPNYMQNPPSWCPPYGMPWNPYNVNYPPPSMGGYPGMPYFDAGMRPPMGNYPGMPYDAGMYPSMGNNPRVPYDATMHPSMGNNPRMAYDASLHPSTGNNPTMPYDAGMHPSTGNNPRMPYDAGMHPSTGNNPRMPYDAGMHPSTGNNPRMPYDAGMHPSTGNNPRMPYSSNNGNA